MLKTFLNTKKSIITLLMIGIFSITNTVFAGPSSGSSLSFIPNPISGSSVSYSRPVYSSSNPISGSSISYSRPVYNYTSPTLTSATRYTTPIYSYNTNTRQTYNPISYSSYTPYSYSTPSYTNYTPYTYRSTSATPSNSSSDSNAVSTTNSTTNSSATASSSNVNINNNTVNVYNTPYGSAVVNNPLHQELDGSCTITPSNPRINQTVTATANPRGGNGTYTYSWGDNYNTSSTYSFTSSYVGQRTITVTIRSGNETITRSCNVYFENENYNNSLQASCYASPSNASLNQNVNWRSSVSGGSGSYTYSWTGTDNLYSNNNNVDKTYSSTGYKEARLTVFSNGQQVTTTCSTNINNTLASNVSVTRSDTGVSTGNAVSGVFIQSGQRRLTTGQTVSGIYLDDLPATGLSLAWYHYIIGFIVMLMGFVLYFVTKLRKMINA